MGLNPRKAATLVSFSVPSLAVVGLPNFDRRDYRRLYDGVRVGMTVELTLGGQSRIKPDLQPSASALP